MFNMSNKTYDILKWVVGVVMPALAALYAALAPLFGLPFEQQVPATIMAAVLFFGAFLQMSSAKYYIEKATYGYERVELSANYPFKMSGEFYDAVKWIAQVALPAVSIAYVAFADIWNLMYAETVTATISAVVFFLSTILQFSSANRKKAVEAIEIE